MNNTNPVVDNNIAVSDIKNNGIFTKKRKSSVCRLKILKDNKFIVNGKSMDEYFSNIELYISPIINVLKLFSLDRGCGFSANVSGGGKSAQSSSIKYALSFAIRNRFKIEFANDEEKYKLYSSILRKNKLLTLDTRVNEPKKYGRAKARKKRQRSKR